MRRFRYNIGAALALAATQLGYVEAPVNRTKYGRWFGWDGVAWCAIWVSWVAAMVGSQLPPLSNKNGIAYVPLIKSHAIATGQWRSASSGYRPKPGDLIVFWFTNRPDHVGMVGPKGKMADGRVHTYEGNCLPVETPVLTPSGWTPIGDLRPGDAVIDPDGQPSAVQAVHHKGRQQVYEVATTTGSVEATADHLWNVANPNWGWRRKTVTTADLASRLERGEKLRLPTIVPPDLDDGGLRELDPWLLGYLLGDGSLTQRSTVAFTSADQEIVDAVVDTLPFGYTLSDNGNGTQRIVHDGRTNWILDQVRGLGVNVGAHSKFVPRAYKWAPVKDRLALLRGLLDADGHVDAEGRIEFTSVSRQLAEDVQFLVRSLGGQCGINAKTNVHYTSPAQLTPKAASDAWRVQNIRFADQSIVPFTLSRKVERCRTGRRLKGWNVRSVTPTRETDVACIEVSAPSRLYVTKDFIPTHNTNAAGSRTGGMVAELYRRSGIHGYVAVDDVAPGVTPPVTPPPTPQPEPAPTPTPAPQEDDDVAKLIRCNDPNHKEFGAVWAIAGLSRTAVTAADYDRWLFLTGGVKEQAQLDAANFDFFMRNYDDITQNGAIRLTILYMRTVVDRIAVKLGLKL